MSPARVLAAPRSGMPALEHSQGDAHSPVTLLQYGDYQCPACQRLQPGLQLLLDDIGHGLRFVYRHYPWVELHPQAELAAEAAEAAAAQGHFWPMHRSLYSPPPRLGAPDLEQHAKALGLDMLRFRGEMADRIYTQRVQEHRAAGHALQLQSTPALLLDDLLIDVSQGLDGLRHAVRAAMAARGPGKHG